MDLTPEYCQKSTIVIGCGNILLGDDGFGPRVIEHLKKNYVIPPKTCVIDAGTGVRKILFDLILSLKKPGKIIIIDAIDKDKNPGEVFEILLDHIPREKTTDFSLHLAPSINLLKELKDLCQVEVIVLACQPAHIPEEVRPGLSKTLKKKVPDVSRLIFHKYLK